MAGRLEARIAIVTGGASGIGRATAVRFAQEGAAVCVADLNLGAATETVRTIELAGGAAFPHAVDTTNEDSCAAMVERCVERLGGVDILIAAAGILTPRPGQDRFDAYNPLDISPGDFGRVLDVNFWGVMHSDRAVARWMVGNRRRGSIVNLASVAAKIPQTHGGGAYSVSKAAVWMWTKVLALELAPAGIRVNAVGPGLIETPMTARQFEDAAWIERRLQMTPLGRPGTPEEVAATILFMASEESSYFTGELLHPSGGMFVG